jgi:hypothetical protein
VRTLLASLAVVLISGVALADEPQPPATQPPADQPPAAQPQPPAGPLAPQITPRAAPPAQPPPPDPSAVQAPPPGGYVEPSDPRAYTPGPYQTYPQPQPQYPQSYPQTYPQTYPQNQPTYPNPNYGGYAPPVPPPPEEEAGCCLWSLRYDPFDLLFRRVTFAAEIAWGKLPFSIELTPKYIFNSPATDVKEVGFDMGVNIAWYPSGKPLKGFWVKAHAEYENFRSTLSRKTDGDVLLGRPDPEQCDADSETGQCTRRVGSAIFGLMVGSSYVFGRKGGFAVSGGIGIGAAVAPAKSLRVLPCSGADVQNKDPHCGAGSAEAAASEAAEHTYYDKAARIRLLGTLGLGITF